MLHPTIFLRLKINFEYNATYGNRMQKTHFFSFLLKDLKNKLDMIYMIHHISKYPDKGFLKTQNLKGGKKFNYKQYLPLNISSFVYFYSVRHTSGKSFFSVSLVFFLYSHRDFAFPDEGIIF